MLSTITANLKPLPVQGVLPAESGKREAAVLLALTTEERPHLILTRRAQHMKDHAGEVALPGGMWEPQDGSLLDTALRESWEEVSLHPDEVTLLATLAPRKTRHGVKVTPYVGCISANIDLQPELSELDAIFRVPLDYLLDKNNLTHTNFTVAGQQYHLPCFCYRGYTIWGFTLMLLVDFLNCSLHANIQLK